MERTKQALREQAKRIRANMSDDERKKTSDRIIARYCELDVYQCADIVLAYKSTPEELELLRLYERVVHDKKKLALPKLLVSISEGAIMEFVFWEPGLPLETKRYGIAEPKEGNIFRPDEWKEKHVEMILPGLCFDFCGNRVGYGGGYYDRYLSRPELKQCRFHKSVLAFDFQIFDPIPCEETDIKYDLLVTERRFFSR